MPRTLQFKRYANTTVASTTGANGELIIDLTNQTITVHNGSKVGGTRLATESYVANTINSFSAYANSDLLLTQAAFNKSNTASNTAISAFNQANASNVLAQSAFNQANTSAQTVPQNAQTTNYTLQLSDAGKHIYYTQSSNTILYIPTTSNVAFSNGTTIMIVSSTSSGANVTVSPNTGVTMYLAGNTTSASRNVTTYGMATLIQVAANTWFINGTGVA